MWALPKPSSERGYKENSGKPYTTLHAFTAKSLLLLSDRVAIEG